MERLTERVDGSWSGNDYVFIRDLLDGDRSIIHPADIIAERLGKYEDTGLTPEEIASIRSRLAEVTAERDAAVSDMKYGIDHIGCDVCKKGQNASECNGNGCDFEWRGLRKED